MPCVTVSLLMCAASLGVDYGWVRGEDGRLEYIIQIEPDRARRLMEGEPISSAIPPHVVGVQRFRVQVGEGGLPTGVVTAGDIGRVLPASANQSGPAKTAPREDSPQVGFPLELPESLRATTGARPLPPGNDAGLSPRRIAERVPALPDPRGFNQPVTIPRESGDDRAAEDAAPIPATPQPRLPAASGMSSPPGASRKPVTSETPTGADQPMSDNQRNDDEDKTSPSDSLAARVSEIQQSVTPPGSPPNASLMIALGILFLSLGGNTYLLWLAVGANRRYRRIARKTGMAL